VRQVEKPPSIRSPAVAAAGVGEDAPGDAEHPRPGVGARRDVVDAAPGDEKTLGDDVGGVGRVGHAAHGVGEQRSMRGLEERREPGLVIDGRRWWHRGWHPG
jgi:hypothetical protein